MRLVCIPQLGVSTECSFLFVLFIHEAKLDFFIPIILGTFKCWGVLRIFCNEGLFAVFPKFIWSQNTWILEYKITSPWNSVQ